MLSFDSRFDKNKKISKAQHHLVSQGGGCEERCKDNDPLCTAATDPHLDLDDYYSDSIFSQDPDENPAFYDYNIAYVPYCSSDWYTGTRNASLLTDGFVFHGKYIVMAIIEDLIQNTWITEAEEVNNTLSLLLKLKTKKCENNLGGVHRSVCRRTWSGCQL